MSAEDLKIVELQSQVAALRKALRDCAAHVGGAVTDGATNEFHCSIAHEVRGVVSTLTAEVERLRAALEQMHTVYDMEHNEVLRLRDAATKATIHLLQTIPDTVRSVLLTEQGGDHE